MKNRATDLEGFEEGLEFYNQLIKGLDLSEEQKNKVAELIESLLGNKELNEIISKNPDLTALASESDAVSNVLDISHHTRKLDEFSSFIDNAEEDYKKLISGEKLEEIEKLSLIQFAILREIASLAPIFKSLNLLDIVNRKEEVEQFYENVMKCHEIMKYLNMSMKIKSEAPKLSLFLTLKHLEAFKECKKYFSFLVNEIGIVKKDLITPKVIPQPKSSGSI